MFSLVSGNSILFISLSTSLACLVVGIDILTREVFLSTAVVIAPFLLVPIIVSISQSPILFLLSTISSLLDIDILSWYMNLYMLTCDMLKTLSYFSLLDICSGDQSCLIYFLIIFLFLVSSFLFDLLDVYFLLVNETLFAEFPVYLFNCVVQFLFSSLLIVDGLTFNSLAIYFWVNPAF